MKRRPTPVWLHFEDGTSFRGASHNAPGEDIWGEAAFTTGMTGYEETATDPSFLGQHIIYSSAHVGNYPSRLLSRQSDRSYATALIARNFSPNALLSSTSIPVVSGIDTRSLVKYLVGTKGSHKGVLTTSPQAPEGQAFAKAPLVCNDLAWVSQEKTQVERPGKRPIAVINYGIKRSILARLKALEFPLITFPYDATSAEIAQCDPRLIFLSNGPGDPRLYTRQIETAGRLLDLGIPVRGICLGHQLISLALGAKITRLPFGQRGINHPVFNYSDGSILITSQNHGYATDEDSFKRAAQSNRTGKVFSVSFRSLFDKSIEGIVSKDHAIKSVQFHPEASPGPDDADFFFDEIRDYLKHGPPKDAQDIRTTFPDTSTDPKTIPYKTVLLIGSGPIRIGQASEFDYSGTQACKALKEIGINVVLLNSNPATIMTDPEMSYKTYIEPITKETVHRIIERENIDAVLSTMGGQTALNICIELERDRYLSERGIALLGAGVETIEKTEDRRLFAQELDKLGYKTGKRYEASDAARAKSLAIEQVGFPLIIRRDYALGGKGAVLVHDADELDDVLSREIAYPVTLEKSLLGFKEVELEVMVDRHRNGVVVCSIENIDPCGVHTGDSITVAPVQTISDRCYQRLRESALAIAKHMGVVAGGANVQFAINPNDEDDIFVIEMNPRVSRSSALASKATGYPIAKISALLAVGFTLKDILNDITKASPVAFEPTQDYVSIKIPVFPFHKFPDSSQQLGPSMRSVGEVLALGGSFNEAFLKALRSLETGLEIPKLDRLGTDPSETDTDYLKGRLQTPRELSLLTALEALRKGLAVEEIASLSQITPWFIQQMKDIATAEHRIRSSPLDRENLSEIKALGFTDKYIALLKGIPEEDVLRTRRRLGILPSYRAVDTCSGEFEALTPYFYSTYCTNAAETAATQALETENTIAIIGSGPNRIGQGIEFDYSCVKSAQRLKEKSIRSIIINSNPETVSTDYDSSDRLYFSPLYSEDLFDIFCHENPKGIVACFAGQTGIVLRERIEESFRKNIRTFNFLGSPLETLHLTEDRKKFAEITKRIDIYHNPSRSTVGKREFTDAITEIGLPVIVRPSYVIGGESMYIFNTAEELRNLPQSLSDGLKNRTTVFHVEKYLEDTLEYDVDVVRDGEGHFVYTICEHIEYAGVHSGDSGMMSPPIVLPKSMAKKIRQVSGQLADILGVIGPINFQYALQQDRLYYIEANPRGSRTLPFLSKAYNKSLPKIAMDAMLGESIENTVEAPKHFYAVKQSTFPFDHFLQDSIILGPKMRSTGETFGIDRHIHHAIMKSYLGNYPKLNEKGKILFSLADPHKHIIVPYLGDLKKSGYAFHATKGTCDYIRRHGHPCKNIPKIKEKGQNIIDSIKRDDFVLVVNTPMNQGGSKSDGEIIRNTAIQYGVPTFTRPENIKAVLLSLVKTHGSILEPQNLQDLWCTAP